MESPTKRLVIGLLVMLLATAGILLKFDKMPGVRLHGGTNGVKFTMSGGGGGGGNGADGGGDGSAGGGMSTRGDDLRLSGWSGNSARRLVIVNNQTLAVGETARVEVRGEKVKVHCLEIRTNSAVVQVEGDRGPTEIFLVAQKSPPSGEAAAVRIGGTNHLIPATGPAALTESGGEKVRLASQEMPTNAVLLQVGDDNKTVEVPIDGQPPSPSRTIE